MSVYEDSYKSQLQGVSQQVPRERLDGQVSEQVNMLADAVTNLRRRPGTNAVFSIDVGVEEQPHAYVAWETVVGSEKCQVLLDSKRGVIRVLDMQHTVVYTSPEIPYLQTTDSPVSAAQANNKYIQHAAVGGEVFLANTLKLPMVGAGSTVSVDRRGFLWVVAGAFNTTYSAYIDVVTEVGFPPESVLVRHTVTYTTPLGTAPGDADLSTPAYIAQQLAAGLDAYVTTVRAGNVLYIEAVEVLRLGSTTSANLINLTVRGRVRSEGELPSDAPDNLDGYIVTVGNSAAKRYYKYVADTGEWLESGDATSPLTLTNTPVALTNAGGVWAVDAAPFEGRFAGDETSNPLPAFVSSGITGLSSYQGRLVILAGDAAYLSASNQPRRFFRSTVTSLLDSDTIGIRSTGTSSATFRYAVAYNNDLVLFSDRHQAIIPGANTALTPRTAVMLPTSEYSSDMGMKPLQVGPWLMYAAPRSNVYFGMLEMLPSGSTEHQYVSSDVTQHLPKYLSGQCRFAVSSSVSSLALFGSATELNSVYVYEYIWDGAEKRQQAWHRWDCMFPIVTSYFSGSSVVLILRVGGYLVGCAMEPHGDRTTPGGDLTSFLDVQLVGDVTDRVLAVPAWFLAATTEEERSAVLGAVATGQMAGAKVQLAYAGGVFSTDASFPTGRVVFGFNYTSTVSPTAPMKKDYQGVRVSTNKMTVLRYNVGTLNSGPFYVSVSDAVPGGYEDDFSPVLYNSPELELGMPIEGADNTVTVPARTRAESTVLTMSSDGVDEFNLVGLEFVAQYHSKIPRARQR